MLGSFPQELSQLIGTEIIVLLRVKPYNKTYPRSSIAVAQFSTDVELLAKFSYSEPDLQAEKTKVRI